MKYINTVMMTFRVIEINRTITSYFVYYWCISVIFSANMKRDI